MITYHPKSFIQISIDLKFKIQRFDYSTNSNNV